MEKKHSKESLKIVARARNKYHYFERLDDELYGSRYRLSFDATPGNKLYQYFNIKTRQELNSIIGTYLKTSGSNKLISLLKYLSISYSESYYDIEP